MTLTGCAESGPPIFERQAGLWRTEFQFIDLASAMITPQMRSEMDPAAFAAFQAQANRPQTTNAPQCVGEEQVYAANLFSVASAGGFAAMGCNLPETERTESTVIMEGACRVGDVPSQMRVEINYAPDLVSTTFISRADATAEIPRPPEMRMRLTETRIGDCPASE